MSIVQQGDVEILRGLLKKVILRQVRINKALRIKD
jgi:hypothetical protein